MSGHLQRKDSDTSSYDTYKYRPTSSSSLGKVMERTAWTNPCLQDLYIFDGKDMNHAPNLHDTDGLQQRLPLLKKTRELAWAIIYDMFSAKHFKGVDLEGFKFDTKFYFLKNLPKLKQRFKPPKFLHEALTKVYAMFPYYTVALEEMFCHTICYDAAYATNIRGLFLQHQKIICEMAMTYYSLHNKAITDEHNGKAFKYKMQLYHSPAARSLKQYVTLRDYAKFLDYVSDMYDYYTYNNQDAS